MALTPQQALERCKQTRDAYQATRRYKDAYWVLQMAYNEGQQWGYIAEQSGNVTVKQLKSVMDIQATQRTRVTINEIGPRVTKAQSMTNPRRIAATVKGPGGVTDTYTRAASRVLEASLRRMSALQVLRDANRDRHVLGTAGIRRCLRMSGPRRPVGPEQSIGTYGIEWATVMPWELIRTPAAKSVHMHRDEETVGHEKPRTVSWVAAHYNGWAPQTDTRLGQVVHFLDEIRHIAPGMGHASLMEDAKERALLVQEFWLTDAAETARLESETGFYVRWPWMFVAYIDPTEDRSEMRGVARVGNQGLLRNPFSGLPIPLLHYHVGTEAMWGTGMPWQLMQWQDFSNNAYTWLAESLKQSAPKWMYQARTVEDPARAFSNDPRVPIPWKRQGQYDSEPQRISGVPVPPVAAEVTRMAPEGLDRQSGIAPVQMGIGYRRDGSGAAYEKLLNEADTIPDDRVTGDELTLGEMFRDTLIDTIRLSTIEQLERLTGGQVSRRLLRELKREDPQGRILDVEVHPSTMRPRSRTQTEQRYVGLASQQVLAPHAAVREATLAGVTGLNTDMERSIAKQEAEIDRMIAGDEIEPDVTENHEWHIQTCRRWLDSIHAMDADAQAVDRVRMHQILHQQAQLATSGLALGQSENPAAAAPGQPSPPANAFEQSPRPASAAGSAEPAMTTN